MQIPTKNNHFELKTVIKNNTFYNEIIKDHIKKRILPLPGHRNKSLTRFKTADPPNPSTRRPMRRPTKNIHFKEKTLIKKNTIILH